MTRRQYVSALAAIQVTEVGEAPLNAAVSWACRSPDDKRIAHTWRQRHAESVKERVKKQVLEPADYEAETEKLLAGANAGGSGTETIASAKTNNALAGPLRAIDWRRDLAVPRSRPDRRCA
jgi:hypothetical protein